MANNKVGLPPKGMRQSKNIGKTLKRIISYLLDYKGLLVLTIVCIIISGLTQTVATFFTGTIVDMVSQIATGNFTDGVVVWADVVSLILVVAGVYIVGLIAMVIYQYLMMYITTRILTKVRDQMFESLQKLPLRYFDSRTHGEIMSSFTNDTDTLRELLSQSLPQFISSIVTTIAVLTGMLLKSPLLTAVAIFMIFLMFGVVMYFGRKIGKHFVAQQNALGKVNGYIEEYIEGQKVVQVFCHEEKVNEGYAQRNGEWCFYATKANKYANMLMPIMGNLSHLNYCIVAVVGSLFMLYGIGNTNIDVLTAMLLYTRQAGMPITQISQQFNAIMTAVAGAERIFDIIDEKPEVDDGYVKLVNANIAEDGTITESDIHTGQWAWKHPHKAKGTVTYTQLKGRVQFDNVNFSYDGKKKILKHLSFVAEPGQKFAFVGSTGAGKTTITNLINRFYDVPDGKIRYDGININKIKKDDLRHSLGMVLQDTHLFTGTVADNIRYGKLDATDEEVIEAAKLANAHSFIMHLPEGYDTMLEGDGSNLSQGQRQLLAIARAAVLNPPVLILDEATSSIDTRTEKLVEKGMDNIMNGRTVFVIAHRLSTVRNSDVIIVLEKGEIIEQGNHETLIEQKGKYYQLYTGKFELS